jgi:predicted nucleic acid-binding protein
MFVLDTNIVSELRKTRSNRADPNVVNWINRYEPAAFFISAITVLELEQGTRMVERRDTAQGMSLRMWLEEIVYPRFSNRILEFDALSAKICARFHIPDPKPERDAMIAATAARHGYTLATRNVNDFLGLGVGLINPWNASP